MRKQKIKKETNFLKTLKFTAVIVISIFVIFTAAKAGNLIPPSGTPEAQFYTLAEIYTRLTTNAASTEGGHDFNFSDSLASTGRTLTEIYDAIPTIVANTVKLNTTYLGVTGTLVPSGGIATTADVCSTKTYFGENQTDWNLATGALTIDAAKVLSGETYCSTAGTMTNVGVQTITPGTSQQTITQGYHDGTGYCEGDADLISANIKSGINIFGINGDGNVVDTSTGDAIASDILSTKKAWVDGSEITGSFASSTATATTEGEEIIPSAGNWLSKVTVAITNLIAGVIKLGETVGGVAGELTPVSGASENLTATDVVCGHKYFGLGATTWAVEVGTGCAVCQECSSGSCVNLDNDTQDTTDNLGITGVCDQTCKKCSGGACANQASNEDLFYQCGTIIPGESASCCGYCDGSAACAYVGYALTCASPGDTCNTGDYSCNGSGGCEEGLWVCGNDVIFTYRGGSVTYGTVSRNGECWMDRNLGASQIATAFNDSAAYGDLFQWGRLDDNHQDRTSGTTAINSGIDNPGHDDFILEPDSPYDWRVPQNNNLWQGVSGINNPCPSGWRIPTEAELEAERVSWGSNDYDGAYASSLKFTVAGYRNHSNGSLYNVGSYGYYWGSTVSGTRARTLYFHSSGAHMYSNDRAYGFSVRCLKD